jgi:hypothetical protein
MSGPDLTSHVDMCLSRAFQLLFCCRLSWQGTIARDSDLAHNVQPDVCCALVNISISLAFLNGRNTSKMAIAYAVRADGIHA